MISGMEGLVNIKTSGLLSVHLMKKALVFRGRTYSGPGNFQFEGAVPKLPSSDGRVHKTLMKGA